MPNLSKAFEFGASVTGHLQAHCKKCGNEASIEYEGHPPIRNVTISCKHCNIAASFKSYIALIIENSK